MKNTAKLKFSSLGSGTCNKQEESQHDQLFSLGQTKKGEAAIN